MNPKRKDWPRYGGAGVTVDPAWHSFQQFLADMGERQPNMTLDRIDNSKGYSAENCRWATWTQQASNRRSNRLVQFDGETLTIAEIARRVGTSRQTIRHRIESGWKASELSMAVNHANGWKRKQQHGN
jgi:response regulator of citrate/malate metabolism